MIEEGLQSLIARLYAELHRHPTVAEIDAQIHGHTPAPEIIEGMVNAAKVFREDAGRDPTDFELQAGLVLADSQAALATYLELEIQVGDRVMWAERDAEGELLHQTLDNRDDLIVPAYGVVTAQPDGWHGENIIIRDDGRTGILGRKWLIKVVSDEPRPVGSAAAANRRLRVEELGLPCDTGKSDSPPASM